jgi:hypothetical protein
MATLKCKFIDNKGKAHSLFYQIYKNDLTDRWINLVKLNLSEDRKIILGNKK